VDSTTRNAFLRDFSAAQDYVNAGVVPSRTKAANSTWGRWATFCTDLAIDPLLNELEDPVALIQVFAHRYRTGDIAPSGRGVRSRTVEDAVRHVAQTFSSVGSRDPRLNDDGKMDFRLKRQLAAYTREDPPPSRVKPIPVQLILHILAAAYACTDVGSIAIAQMAALTFFFLLRPGEYTSSPSDTTPFTLQDVQLFIGVYRLNLVTASEAEIHLATFGTLTFTTQKNGVKGEVIGLGRSHHSQLCPVKILIERVIHLRRHNAPPSTPLATFYNADGLHKVKPSDITDVLRAACRILGPALGLAPGDISARSLRAGGAMALLIAKVDTDIIQLIGRWQSDVMLHYLTTQAEPVMRDFAQRMVYHGAFVLHPSPTTMNMPF